MRKILHCLIILYMLCIVEKRWAGHVACMEDGRVACRVLVGKSEGKRPLGTYRRRWEDNFKMDLGEI